MAEPESVDPILSRVKSVIAQALPSRPEVLAKTLTEGLTTDEAKLAAIQHWVVEVLVYDYEGLNSGRAIYDAATCYKTGKGVCQAIAGLYIQMARSVGVPVEEVAGEARELMVTADGPKSNWIPHAWVRYRSPKGIKWIDPTFSLPGQIKGKVTPGLGWFLLDPNQMAQSHRPTRNRIADEPLLSRELADSAPSWDWGALRQHNLLPLDLPSDLKLDDKIGFAMPKTKGVEFMASIEKAGTYGGTGKGQALVLKGAESTKFLFSPSAEGWQKIQLFVKQQGSPEPYRSLCTIPLLVSSIAEKAVYPELYADFTTMGVEIVSGGESGLLPENKELELKYKMSAEGTLVLFPKKDSGLSVSDIREFNKKEGDIWEWKGRLTSGEWLLGARLPNSNRVKFLALYRVKPKE